MAAAVTINTSAATNIMPVNLATDWPDSPKNGNIGSSTGQEILAIKRVNPILTRHPAFGAVVSGAASSLLLDSTVKAP
jgi:hypothetical protein